MSDEFKKKIMRKIYGIWFARKVAPAMFLYLPFLIFVAMRETAREFFVAKIMDNFAAAVHGGVVSTINYLVSALANTPVFPVLIIMVSLCGFGILFWRLIRSIKMVRLAKNF